jgi:hypothetical protein
MNENEKFLLDLEHELIRDVLQRDPGILNRILDPDGQLRRVAQVLTQKRGCRR